MKGRCYWSELPSDIVVRILGLIPVGRKLIELKCVCKEWNFVISRICIPRQSPPYPDAQCWGFISFLDNVVPGERGRLNHLKFDHLSDYLRQDIERPDYHPPMLDNIWSIVPEEERASSEILDYCNGMMLMASKSQLYVGNPVTKESFCVPVNPKTSAIPVQTSLVFDPSSFLCQDRDPYFNIVSFASVSHPMKLDIYSSDTGDWCTHVVEIEEPHHRYGYEWVQRSVYFNRALYSLFVDKYLVCIDNIVPTPKRAWAIALPDKDDDDEVFPDSIHCGCIGYTSGRFLYSNRDEKQARILVWMLESSSKWVLMHNISIRQDIGHSESLLGPKTMELYKWRTSFRTRVFHPNDHDGASKFYMGSLDFFLSYDPVIKETNVHYLCFRPETKIRVDGNWIFPFSPCLLLLKPTT